MCQGVNSVFKSAGKNAGRTVLQVNMDMVRDVEAQTNKVLEGKIGPCFQINTQIVNPRFLDTPSPRKINMGLALAIEHARAQGLVAEETNASTARIYQHQARALVEDVFDGGGDHDDDDSD